MTETKEAFKKFINEFEKNPSFYLRKNRFVNTTKLNYRTICNIIECLETFGWFKKTGVCIDCEFEIDKNK